MNPAAAEYLGPTGANGNGNGNGNGHGKIFDLAPKQDMVLAKIVPEARRRICLNNLLSAAARMFFCFLTDTSLLFGVNVRKGVVKFSDADLANRFRVNARTIRTWKRELESTGEIWTTERWMKNSFPVTVYNVTCIPEVGPRPEQKDAESQDGSLVEDFASNRRRRPAGRDPFSGKFARRDTPPSPGPILPERPKIEDLAVDKGPDEFFQPSTAEKNSRPPRLKTAVLHGEKQPTPTAKNSRLGRLKTAVADGEKQPQSAAENSRSGRLNSADNRETGVGESASFGVRGEALPTEKQEEAWIKSLERMYPRELSDLERLFTKKIQLCQSPEGKSVY
ncbi:MAG: hypothetical protein KGL39_26125, partial [Patescibacteria group bacterium]|nr:hypothetical protein [Patescibacteria group bacterium]